LAIASIAGFENLRDRIPPDCRFSTFRICPVIAMRLIVSIVDLRDAVLEPRWISETARPGRASSAAIGVDDVMRSAAQKMNTSQAACSAAWVNLLHHFHGQKVASGAE